MDGKSLYFRRPSTVSSSAPRSRRHAHLAADASRPAALPMIEVDGVQNLHTLHGYRGPLGVECTCGRRGVVSAKTLGLYPGNIREIRALPFICRECGSRKWTGWIFTPEEDALDWARRAPG